jgi:polysaccharide pyruvyl transferase WcaK-like protein
MNISLSGFYSKHNFGDDLMQYHLGKILSQSGQNTVTVYSDTSGDTVQNGYQTQEHLGADVIVIGGGGIVNPNFWVFKKDGLSKLANSGKPIIFLNVNVNPNDLRDAKFVSSLQGLHAQWYVRDTTSIRVLSQCNIVANLLPDVSFRRNVSSPLTNSVARELSVFVNGYAFNNLFTNAFVDKYLQSQSNIKVIAGFLDWMTHFGWHINLVPSQVSGNIDDRIISGMIYGTMKNKDKTNWITSMVPWQDIIMMISQSQMVLSMRYHSSAMAVASQIPLIDIAHHNKNKSLIQDVDIPGIMTDYFGLTQQSLVRAAQIAENSNEYQNNVALFNTTAQSQWMYFEQSLSNILAGVKHV